MTAELPRAGGRAAYAVSPSQIRDFDLCERAWYLGSVARAQDDGNAGGLYLAQGDLFDEAVQRHAAKMDLHADDLVAAVQAKPGLRGAALGLTPEKWAELAERAARMLRAVQPALPAPKTASVQKRYRVLVPGYEARGGVVITGKTDLHQPGYVVDTKSTADRGPGRAAAADRKPTALTDETTPGGNVKPLRDDVQARVYAWCEFQTNPLLAHVRCRWVYASKPSGGGNPVGWHVEAVFERAETEAWFASYVRPRLDRMVELHEASQFELAPFEARANTDSCLRCFRRLSCQNPFAGAQAPLPEGAVILMPTAAEIRARQAARAAGAGAAPPPAAPAPQADVLEAQLRASLSPAVTGFGLAPQGLDPAKPNIVDFSTVNRPASAASAAPASAPPPTVVTTTGIDVTEAPAIALREALSADAEEAAAAAPLSEPRRGRGRPRKPRPPVADDAPRAPASAGSAETGANPASAAAPAQRTEALERIATALQAVADAADAAVAVVIAELRELGVRL